MKKLTIEEFIERARKVHGNKYDYSKSVYIDCKTPICITCPEHGDFYQIPDNHIRKGYGCPKCGNIKKSLGYRQSKEVFLKRANEFHNFKYDYSKAEFIDMSTPITIICPIHGEFILTPDGHLHGGCRKCGIEKARMLKSSNTNEFIEQSKKIHNNVYDYSKVNYINNHTLVIITCPIHGDFLQLPHLHLAGAGCKKCADITNGLLRRHTTENFINRAKEIHHNKYDYSNTIYKLDHEPVAIICPEHGEFWQRPDNHLLGKGCPLCSLKAQSNVYQKLIKLFPNLEILFEVNKEIVPWLETLRFDIYIPSLNLAIEYDGLQHLIPVKFFGGELGFIRRQKLDKYKENLCHLHNCLLIRLLYNYTDEDFLQLCNTIKNSIDQL